MDNRPHIVALDFDSQNIYLAVGTKDTTQITQPLSRASTHPHSALRRGAVIDKQDLARTVGEIILTIDQVYHYRPPILLGVHPASLFSERFVASMPLIPAGGSRMVTEEDVEQMTADLASQFNAKFPNAQLLHSIPIEYAIDGVPLSPGTTPVSNKARKLECEALCIGCHAQHVQDCIDILHNYNSDVQDAIATPLAMSFVVTEPRHRMLGCAVLCIASETTTLIVFMDGVPIGLSTFPIGIEDIIGDLALGMQIDVATARNMLYDLDKSDHSASARKRANEIVNARYLDIIEASEKYLLSLGWQGLLPGGLVIVSTSHQLPGLIDMARAKLKLPARTWDTDAQLTTQRRKAKDFSMLGAYSIICAYGRQTTIFFKKTRIFNFAVRDMMGSFKAWVSRFFT